MLRIPLTILHCDPQTLLWSEDGIRVPKFPPHYVAYWAGDQPTIRLDTDELTLRAGRLKAALDEVLPKLEAQNLRASDVDAILFVGNNSANGHAFESERRYFAWFALECFHTDFAARIFAAHELIHAIHYRASPGFYFSNISEKELLWRTLISEGIASYLTMTLLEVSEAEALWADYLEPAIRSEWMDNCSKSLEALARYALDNFESSDHSDFFAAAEPGNIFRYRAGYFLGLKAIKTCVQKHGLTPLELLNIPALEFKTACHQALRELQVT